MKRLSMVTGAWLAALIAADVAFAQFIPPGGPQIIPQPAAPPPLPPPKIEVPKVPQMDEVPRQNFQAAPRPSFGEKVTTCQEQSAAAGLSPSERDVYVRACANSR